MINNLLTKTYLILLFNANGLKNHANEIQTVLYEKRIDITLITETHQIFPGYIIYKSNHPDKMAHGGVAIIIKFTLSFSSLPNFTLEHLQTCAVIIKPNNIPITIVSIYCSPRQHLSYSV
jgi:exonuclease III